MPYNIIIRLLATTEIIEAFDWYETQRAGLGNEFLDELDSFTKDYGGTHLHILIMKNL